MMINRIYQKVKVLLNTVGRGNVSPAEFNLILFNAIEGRYEMLMYELNRQTNRENVGRQGNGIENLPEKYREKILHYLVEEQELENDEDGNFPFPEDFKYFDTFVIDERTFEFTKNKKEFDLIKTQVTRDYPIALFINGKIRIAPALTEDELEAGITGEISYIRKPKFPKWTYTVVNNVELFNPDAEGFQDADVHPSEENEMVRRVLLGFGVNLKEQDIQAVVMQEDNQEFNKQNTP